MEKAVDIYATEKRPTVVVTEERGYGISTMFPAWSAIRNGRKKRYYQPFATRSPIILFFLIATLASIVLLETCMHQGSPAPTTQNKFGGQGQYRADTANGTETTSASGNATITSSSTVSTITVANWLGLPISTTTASANASINASTTASTDALTTASTDALVTASDDASTTADSSDTAVNLVAVPSTATSDSSVASTDTPSTTNVKSSTVLSDSATSAKGDNSISETSTSSPVGSSASDKSATDASFAATTTSSNVSKTAAALAKAQSTSGGSTATKSSSLTSAGASSRGKTASSATSATTSQTKPSSSTSIGPSSTSKRASSAASSTASQNKSASSSASASPSASNSASTSASASQSASASASNSNIATNSAASNTSGSVTSPATASSNATPTSNPDSKSDTNANTPGNTNPNAKDAASNTSGATNTDDTATSTASATAGAVQQVDSNITPTANGATPSPSSTPLYEISTHELIIPGPYTQGDYFKALYAGTVGSVLFKSAWGPVFASAKMLEPFYQLNKERGSSARGSLLSGYLAEGMGLKDLLDVFEGHWVMASTTLLSVLFSVMCSVASESMTIRARDLCHTSHGPEPCHPAWIVEIRVVRTLEALLGLTTLLLLIILFCSWRRVSGVFTYPCSIGAMAALLHNEEVLDDFRSIDPRADEADVIKALAGNHYKFDSYDSPSGAPRYGLIKCSSEHIESSSSSQNSRLSRFTLNPTMKSFIDGMSVLPWSLMQDIALLAVQVAYFIFVLVYQVGGGKNFLFSSSARFGPRFFLTIIATTISGQWYRLEQEVRVMVPYRKLARRNAHSESIIRMSLHGTPFTTFPAALYHGNWFHALVACVAVLSELMVISVSGVPYNYGQIEKLSLRSCYATLVILGLMSATMLLILFWRRSNPDMPRKPDTLAGVWLNMCASRMLDDFEGMEELSGRHLKSRTEGKTYWAGKGVGVDGKERFMVDKEN